MGHNKYFEGTLTGTSTFGGPWESTNQGVQLQIINSGENFEETSMGTEEPLYMQL